MFEINDPLAGHKQLYVLQGNKPVRCTNTFKWLEWMKATPLPAERTVLNGSRVLVTTFVGYAGDRRESQPLTFATAIKPEPQLPDFTATLEWYFSWEEAKASPTPCRTVQPRFPPPR